MAGSANTAVIRCIGLVRRKRPFIQPLAGDGNWAGWDQSAFGSRTGETGLSTNDARLENFDDALASAMTESSYRLWKPGPGAEGQSNHLPI